MNAYFPYNALNIVCEIHSSMLICTVGRSCVFSFLFFNVEETRIHSWAKVNSKAYIHFADSDSWLNIVLISSIKASHRNLQSHIYFISAKTSIEFRDSDCIFPEVKLSSTVNRLLLSEIASSCCGIKRYPSKRKTYNSPLSGSRWRILVYEYVTPNFRCCPKFLWINVILVSVHKSCVFNKFTFNSLLTFSMNLL